MSPRKSQEVRWSWWVLFSVLFVMCGLPERAASSGEQQVDKGATSRLQIGKEAEQMTPAVRSVTATPLTTKLVSADSTPGNNLGRSLALSSDGMTLVGGAFYEQGNGGSAYVFERYGQQWSQVKKLTGNTNENDWFGVAVAIAGDTLAVGSSRYDDGAESNAGAVYIFQRNQGGSNNWGLVKKVRALDANSGDSFGISVALQDHLLVVGARFDDEKNPNAGAVYLFARDQGGSNNWGQLKKIMASDGASKDYLGEGVAISGDRIAVRAHVNDGTLARGAVYLFGRNQGGVDNWGEIKKLTFGDLDANTASAYNYPVSIDGDTILAGAPLADVNGVDSGGAYLFARNQGGKDNWGLVKVITADDTTAGDNLGSDVLVAGDSLVIGAPQEDETATGAGAAYLFARDQGGANNWGLLHKFVAPTNDANDGDNLGRAVALRNNLLSISAYKDDSSGQNDVGALYTQAIGGNLATITFASATYYVSEAGAATAITVGLDSPATQPVQVNYLISNGSASSGSDYTATPGTLTFDPGQTLKTFTIAIVDDNVSEGNETVNLALNSPVNGLLGGPATAQLIIIDNEGPVSIQFNATNVSAREDAGNPTVNVGLSHSSPNPITVNYQVVGGTASVGADYNLNAGVLTFNPGQTSQLLPISLLNDALDEADETVVLVLSNPTPATVLLNNPGYTATLTIQDDDPTPSLTVEQANYTIGEGAGSVAINILLTAPAARPVKVNYTTNDISATAPHDYTATPGVLLFNPGETRKTITVALTDDTLHENGEDVEVRLFSPEHALLLAPFSAVVTISDNDPPPAVAFSTTTLSAAENSGAVQVTVNLNTAAGRAVTVEYATSGGTAVAGADYIVTPDALTFAPGETSQTFSVLLREDTLPETDETIQLVLRNPTNATLGVAALTLTITNQNSCYTLSLSHSGPGSALVAAPANSPDCPSGQYKAGENIRLTATPDPPFVVLGWTGTANDASQATENNLTMQAANRSVSVVYGRDDRSPGENCDKARLIPTDGAIQHQAFDRPGGDQWLQFAAVAGKPYLIEVTIPPTSPADVALELYTACSAPVKQGQDYTFSPGVRLEFTAAATGPVFLKLVNKDTQIAGPDVSYDLTVRALSETVAPGALILVAGSLSANDRVKSNIYHVADAAYQLFLDNGYTDDRIYYLAPDRSHSEQIDALATVANLQAAITQWAKEQVTANGALTLYIIDHGSKDLVYLDKPRRQWVSPDQLDQWLSQLEATHTGLKINIIIEACYAGSFISQPASLSKAERVIITSTDDRNLAWASSNGAVFSDYFLAALRRGESLYSSYRSAQSATQIAHPAQAAWIDGNGDGAPGDSGKAAQRGFTFAGTFPDELWPPYLANVEPPATILNGRGELRVEVRDDQNAIDHVWAVIYPPGHTPPTEGEALVQEALPTVTLLDQGNGQYAATYTDFRQSGTYRIVFYAEDKQDLAARPVALTVQIGRALYLPLIYR